MMARFEPELGQLAFGQPSHRYSDPEWLESLLRLIEYALYDIGVDPSPFGNTGERFENDTFTVEAYSWDDEYEQPSNFKWRDVEISWYKWMGRGMSVNQELSLVRGREMLADCLKSLETP